MEIRAWSTPSAHGVAGALSFVLSSPGSRPISHVKMTLFTYGIFQGASHEVITACGVRVSAAEESGEPLVVNGGGLGWRRARRSGGGCAYPRERRGRERLERLCARAVRVEYLSMIVLSYQPSEYGYQASASYSQSCSAPSPPDRKCCSLSHRLHTARLPVLCGLSVAVRRTTDTIPAQAFNVHVCRHGT